MNPEKFYTQLYTWILNITPKLVLAIIVLIVGLWFIRRLGKWINIILTRRNVDPTLRPFLSGTLNLGLQVLLVLAVMQILTIQMTVFAALIGAFGVAAGLALSGTLQNFTSGIIILIMKPFRLGDIINAQGKEGTVTTIRMFYTVVTTFDNSTVIIPNSKLSNEVITNFSKQGNRRMDIELKFNFGIDYEQVKTIIEKSIDANSDLLNDPAYKIGVSSVDPDGYKIMINVWVNAHAFQDMKMQFQKELIEDLKSSGIKLPGL
jgi:small conductance mechanosensitive channel